MTGQGTKREPESGMQISSEQWQALCQDVAVIKRLLEGNGTPGLVQQVDELQKLKYKAFGAMAVLTLLMHALTEGAKAWFGIGKGH